MRVMPPPPHRRADEGSSRPFSQSVRFRRSLRFSCFNLLCCPSRALKKAYLRYLSGSTAGTPCFFTRNTTNFAGFERDGLGALQLHHDRTLEHVDEGVRVVSMDFVSAARRVGDRKDETFFAGNVREGFGHDFFYVGSWSSRRELRRERTSSDCDRQDDLFHSDFHWLSSDLLFFQRLTRKR